MFCPIPARLIRALITKRAQRPATQCSNALIYPLSCRKIAVPLASIKIPIAGTAFALQSHVDVIETDTDDRERKTDIL
jgi:hypothetical protein